MERIKRVGLSSGTGREYRVEDSLLFDQPFANGPDPLLKSRTPRCGARALGAAFAVSLACGAPPANAWGEEGHEVVALIAERFLEPAVDAKVRAILAEDTSGLTSSTQVDQEATWADRFRDSDRNTSKIHYKQTRDWHFVDLELDGADMTTACFGRPALSRGTVASSGPADDCIVDKVDEFSAELANAATRSEERRLALQFLLHFIGDMHQPLHASDDHDRGGNLKMVSARGMAANTLHHYWDVEFVERLGTNETSVAEQLIASITATQRAQWATGTAADWAMETYSISKDHAYGRLPAADSPNHYRLSDAYVEDATRVTREQLSKAGVRLAAVLNRALAKSL